MAQQWLRAINLTASGAGGALDLSNMRIQFHTEHFVTQTPAVASIRVSNLSDSTVQQFINKEFDQITLAAGYRSNIGQIFQGQITQCRSGQELDFTTTYLDIIATNPNRNYKALVNKTLGAGSTPRDHYNLLLSTMPGVTQGFLPTDGRMDQPKYPRSVTFYGMTRDYLRVLAHSLNSSWFIDQNNQLNMLPVEQAMPGVIQINARTGMVGLPVQTTDGIIVRALLRPDIVPGTSIQLNNASIQQALLNQSIDGQPLNQAPNLPPLSADGIYKVIYVEYIGDIRGEPWYVDVTCYSASAGPPQSQISSGAAGGESDGGNFEEQD